MAFGKSFYTLKEARVYALKQKPDYRTDLSSFAIRRMSEKLYPK